MKKTPFAKRKQKLIFTLRAAELDFTEGRYNNSAYHTGLVNGLALAWALVDDRKEIQQYRIPLESPSLPDAN